jgi:hypothetical protein
MTPKGSTSKSNVPYNVINNPHVSPMFKTMLNAKRNTITAFSKHKINTNEDAHILENLEKNISIVENDMNSPERIMLLKYTFNWTELAIAYQQEGYFEESVDCIDSAAAIYDKLMMHPHLAVCLGLFLLAKVTVGISARL